LITKTIYNRLCKNISRLVRKYLMIFFLTYVKVQNPMSRLTKRVMKVALTMVLFQFLAPALLLSPRGVQNQDQTSYSLQHNLLVVPVLLKEKDEADTEKSLPGSKQILLLDLIAHYSNLKTTCCKYIFLRTHSYDSQPRLFALYRVYLI
jgi:hypothetical protein